ncbi:MAG: CvpA family protein [Desulfobacterales bacterium]|nr:CvpA family protein [Desulfobacterales bacterium]
MNTFDIIISAIFGYCLVRGLFRGLIKELASIIGVFSGFYAAYTYYNEVARMMSDWISNTGYLNIISFLIIFCLIFIIISIMGIIIKYLLNIVFLGWVDRLFGAIFGMIKAVLIASVLLIAFTSFLPKGGTIIESSILAPHVAMISEKMAKVISKDMKKEFQSNIWELKKSWDEQKKKISR